MKKGFTIIELLIFMGLFSIIIYVMMDLLAISFDVKSQSEMAASINQDGRFILEKFMVDIDNANSIVAPNLGGSSSQLDYILYGKPQVLRLNNNNLELVNDSGTYILNSYNTQVKQLTFTRYGNISGRNSVQISFQLQSNNRLINLSTTAGLR